ncbi:glycosyltransferase family 2 protein [Microbacterium sp. Sa1CUA4]|uniref:4,4'-diaponeurosporenoate glycosyltransferase n=1 Tax=Microbacterium gallinarum TaxID=2762209 RepID=A0ABR8X3B3_9MICO|nr:glycosyltransferase family 2 protein [Microbacterium gallinarum]
MIPAFNAEATLAGAIQSGLLAGASKVVVVDDGSVDGTAQVAWSAGADVLTQQNAGATAARRRGLRSVDSEYVVLLDADDRLVREGAEIACGLLASDETLGAVVGQYVRNTGGVSATQDVPLWPEGVTLRALVRRGHAPAPPGAVIWRTAVLREVFANPMPALEPRWAEDFETLVRGTMLSRIATLESRVCVYSTVGGKSDQYPLRSLEAAELIRRHYAELAGIDIAERTPADLRALVKFRRAMGTKGVARVWLGAQSIATSPRLYLQLARARLRRVANLRRGHAHGIEP